MKKFYLFLFVLFMSVTVLFAQSNKDTVEILQLCVDLPELQQYYPTNLDGSVKKRCIMQYPVAFSPEVIESMNGEQVVFHSIEAIKANQEAAYFTFRHLNVDNNKAAATANYFYNYDHGTGSFEMISLNITLDKTAGQWNVVDLNMKGIAK